MLTMQLDGIFFCFVWENGERGGEHRKRSPVKRASQEVGGRAEPAHAVCDGAYTGHSLVLLLGRTLILRQVVWDVCVLLYQHCSVLLEWHHQLHKYKSDTLQKR